MRNPQPFTEDALSAICERLGDMRVRLLAVHESMKTKEIDQLLIVNATEMRKGLDKIEAFVSASTKALTDHRLGPESDDN